MIIEENKKEERIKKLKEVLKLDLPENYEIDFSEQYINRKIFFGIFCQKVVSFLLRDDYILLEVEDEKEYKKIKSYLEQSETKFKVNFGESYY